TVPESAAWARTSVRAWRPTATRIESIDAFNWSVASIASARLLLVPRRENQSEASAMSPRGWLSGAGASSAGGGAAAVARAAALVSAADAGVAAADVAGRAAVAPCLA